MQKLMECDDDEIPCGEITSDQWDRQNLKKIKKNIKIINFNFRISKICDLSLIIKTLQRRLKVPDWQEFCSKIETLWHEFKTVTEGEVS